MPARQVLAFEPGGQQWTVHRSQVGDEVDVVGRARGAVEGAGQRPAKQVVDTEIFERADAYARHEMRRRLRVDIGAGEPIDVASAEDSVLQKLLWYRRGGELSDRQWQDLLGVLKVRRQDLDFEYLERWADDQKVTDLLERALADAGIERSSDRT